MNGRIVRRALYRHERDGGITASHTTWRSFVHVYVFHTAMYWANPFLPTVLKTCENRNLFSCWSRYASSYIQLPLEKAGAAFKHRSQQIDNASP